MSSSGKLEVWHGLWDQNSLGLNRCSRFIFQVILGKLPNLPEALFQMLYGVDNYFIRV